MDNKDGYHLSIGTLIALAQFGLYVDENHEVKKHLENCDVCSKNYQTVIKLLESSKSNLFVNTEFPKFFQDCENPNSNLKKICTLIMIFLEADLQTQELSILFRHINDCYPCFESFAKNWNDYQTIRKIFRG